MSDQSSDSFDAKMDRIAEQVDEIARFVGRTAELQMQTQIKLDEIAEIARRTDARLDRMVDKFDQKLDRITETFDKKFDRISDTISDMTTAIREQSSAASEQNTELTRSIREQNTELTRAIREQSAAANEQNTELTRAIREQTAAINGYQEIAREQTRSTAELIKLVTILSTKAS